MRGGDWSAEFIPPDGDWQEEPWTFQCRPCALAPQGLPLRRADYFHRRSATAAFAFVSGQEFRSTTVPIFMVATAFGAPLG